MVDWYDTRWPPVLFGRVGYAIEQQTIMVQGDQN